MKCTSLSTARYIIGTAPKGVHPSIGRFSNSTVKKEEQPAAPSPKISEAPTEEPEAATHGEIAPEVAPDPVIEETPAEEAKPVKKTTKRTIKKKA